MVMNQNVKREQGRKAQLSNIQAGKAVSEIVRTTLGPRSMLKMLLDPMGGIVMTNDGNSILREVDVSHPAAKSMIELSRAQEEEVGDGTTSVIVLAGEVLAQAEPLLERQMHPTVICNGYLKALDDAVKVDPPPPRALHRHGRRPPGDAHLGLPLSPAAVTPFAPQTTTTHHYTRQAVQQFEIPHGIQIELLTCMLPSPLLQWIGEIAQPLDTSDRDMMIKLIESCTGTKFIARFSRVMVDLALDAVQTVHIDDSGRKEIDIKRYAKVEKIAGGDIEDCRVLKGVMINKDVVHGKMRRRIEKPRILLLDCTLEYKKGESQTTIELTDEAVCATTSHSSIHLDHLLLY